MEIKNYINATMPLNSVTVSPNNGLIDSHQSLCGVTFYDVKSAMSLCVDGLDKPVNMGILALHTIFLHLYSPGHPVEQETLSKYTGKYLHLVYSQ